MLNQQRTHLGVKDVKISESTVLYILHGEAYRKDKKTSHGLLQYYRCIIDGCAAGAQSDNLEGAGLEKRGKNSHNHSPNSICSRLDTCS